MSAQATRYSATKQRPNLWLVLAIVLFHVLVLYGLVRVFAPDVVASVEQSVVSTFTVNVTAPPPEPEPPVVEPEPDEGAQGDPGKEAVPKPDTAPEPKVPIRKDPPAPRASSTGTADTSGATNSGSGTGAAGSGMGTGAGRGGGGQGGVAVTKPVLIQSITDASAFPVPPGGRKERIGKSVIVRLSVSPQGRVTACSIHTPSPFPETDAVVCRLAADQVRFEPARDALGQPVKSTFYYRQRFFN